MKKIVVLIIAIIFQNAVYPNNQQLEETSRFLLFLGRFHPLILHLPIGALLITFYLDIIGRIKKNYPHKTIKYALGFSAFFAIFTCVFGYFLSLEGGYDSTTLDIHFWIGILAAIMISLLFVMSRLQSKNIRLVFFPFFVLTIICLSVAGHYGSILTHGDNFITEYATAPAKQKTIIHVDSLKIYDDVIHKILDDKCTQCHNATKKKGDLSLLSKATILKGGENGKIAHANDAAGSNLYSNIVTPLSDEEHMPPEGKPQLTKSEIWILKYWIDNGLDFNSKVTTLPKSDTLNKLLKNYLVFEKVKIPFASQSDIAKIRLAGFKIYNLVPNKPELSAKSLKTELKKSDVRMLSKIKEQLIELDLSNSGLTDKMTTTFKEFKNLKKLRIENNNLTDKALKNIEGLENLESLNIHNTSVSNNGLEQLLAKNSIKSIYSWESKVDDSFAKELSKKYQVNISNGVFDGFIEKTALKKPTLITKKTLFIDSTTIELKSNMRASEIRYTLNNTEPNENSTIYTEPIAIKENVTIKAKAYKKDWYPSETLSKNFAKIGLEIETYTIAEEPDPSYPDSKKLFDLEEGSDNFRDGKWNGFNGNDIVTHIDLGASKTVSNVSVNSLELFKDYILFPKKIKIYVSESKGSDYKKLGELKIKSKGVGSVAIIKRFSLDFPETTSQYFKIIVENPKTLPITHTAAGEKSWIFVDEIMLQ